jgi:hypothetical protein
VAPRVTIGKNVRILHTYHPHRREWIRLTCRLCTILSICSLSSVSVHYPQYLSTIPVSVYYPQLICKLRTILSICPLSSVSVHYPSICPLSSAHLFIILSSFVNCALSSVSVHYPQYLCTILSICVLYQLTRLSVHYLSSFVNCSLSSSSSPHTFRRAEILPYCRMIQLAPIRLTSYISARRNTTVQSYAEPAHPIQLQVSWTNGVHSYK